MRRGAEFPSPARLPRTRLTHTIPPPPRPEQSSPAGDLADLEPSPPSEGPRSWRHRQPNLDDTMTDLAAEGWSMPPPSASRDSSDGPSSSRHPLTMWRPKQQYPSFAPPSGEELPVRGFVIKVLDSSAELVQSYRLRYEMFEALGYMPQGNRAKLEIDEYDMYSIPFGAITVDTRELVGTLRLITNDVQSFYDRRIRRILDFCRDPALTTRVFRPRAHNLPSITSDHVAEMVTIWNKDGETLEELSRTITHQSVRGFGVARAMLEFGLAYATLETKPRMIGACIPEHVPMYAAHGFETLPGTRIEANNTVGQLANTLGCDSRHLPEPTSSRVRSIIEAMLSGEAECMLEVAGEVSSHKRRYHFGEIPKEGTRYPNLRLSGIRYSDAPPSKFGDPGG